MDLLRLAAIYDIVKEFESCFYRDDDLLDEIKRPLNSVKWDISLEYR